MFRTELRRTWERKNGPSAAKSLLTKRTTKTEDAKRIPDLRQTAQRLLRFAQQIGVVGSGLLGGDGTRYGGNKTTTVESNDFFPELLKLSWPPEGRLIEKDCSCKIWDSIGGECVVRVFVLVYVCFFNRETDRY